MSVMLPLAGSLGPLGAGWSIPQTETFDDYAIAQGLTLYYKCDEASGNALNYGTLGSAGDAAVNGTGITRQATGQLGAGHAITLDGTNTNIATPWNAAWATPTTFALFMLLRYNSDGGAPNSQRVFGRNVGPFFQRDNSNQRLIFFVKNSVPTFFGSATIAGYVANGTHHLLFCEYNDAGDRVPRIYTNGTEVTYSATPAPFTSPPLTGTLQTFSSPNTFTWFNNQVVNVGVDVTVSAFGYLAGSVFTSQQRQQLTLLAGL